MQITFQGEVSLFPSYWEDQEPSHSQLQFMCEVSNCSRYAAPCPEILLISTVKPWQCYSWEDCSIGFPGEKIHLQPYSYTNFHQRLYFMTNVYCITIHHTYMTVSPEIQFVVGRVFYFMVFILCILLKYNNSQIKGAYFAQSDITNTKREYWCSMSDSYSGIYNIICWRVPQNWAFPAGILQILRLQARSSMLLYEKLWTISGSVNKAIINARAEWEFCYCRRQEINTKLHQKLWWHLF